MTDTVKYVLDETHIPKYWYNLVHDLPAPPPPVLHPGTLQPVGPDDLAPLFPMELIMQEVATEREIPIPEPVRAVYRQWRRRRCSVRGAWRRRCRRRRKSVQVRRREPGGQPQANTAVPQAFYNKQAGVKRLVTETGAGQWVPRSPLPVHCTGWR
jgi:tryptophan synthase beta chain